MINCECADRGCPVNQGMAYCLYSASQILYRVDMEDLTGTPMCDRCASDAYESGVFTSEAPVRDCPDGHLCERCA